MDVPPASAALGEALPTGEEMTTYGPVRCWVALMV
jgi:hypothetical protein